MDALTMWVVYDKPRDCPDHVVARRFDITDEGARPSRHIIIGKTLDLVRPHLERMGLVRLDRNEGDDPVIVETWL